MTKLEEMWVALLAYLPQAISNGHGESWAKMCSERTAATAYAAAGAAWAATAAATAAADADRAAAWVAYAAYAADATADAAAEYWAQKAIDSIKSITVVKEVNA